ncbi:MAG: glycosyl hydrolase [Lachnospiraceae bacterium]|nr:glycosyl hydrolase [Lachnospiraceae bacterium]
MDKIFFSKKLAYSYAFDGGIAELNEADGSLIISLPYQAAFGGGERFNTLNLKGQTINIAIEEKFCEQGDKSYCPMPFFLTDSGFGLYAADLRTMSFTFNEESIVINGINYGTELVLFSGPPRAVISEYMSLFGTPALPPDWAFLPWISAHRWNTQEKAELQLLLLKQYDFPAGVMVLEAWSDEATFYIFNDAQYDVREDGAFKYEDFSFPENARWPDPKAMIEKIHAAGLRVILWQCPVFKLLSPDENQNAQNDLDRKTASARGLCVKLADGNPYEIPAGNWFAGSMIPDFTNPETVNEWFLRRQYLLDIGVDGFKTDGGEFIYRDDLRFHDGRDGAEMKNGYSQSYVKAYTDFVTDKRVLFSRSGFAGQHMLPILWAGDQLSTFSELRAQLKAGLSASMSGIIFWGFDIGGFAGPLPSRDLYLRATQMACFCPIMQWHSEPIGGQFKELLATNENDNERSPWNIASKASDALLLSRLRFYHKLREKLVPYLSSQAKKCAALNRPLIYPLFYAYPADQDALLIDDQFMLGDDYLVAPILTENTAGRSVYLPEGKWKNYFGNEEYAGNQTIFISDEWHIPVFERQV